jgi:hypothetical protein
MIIKQKYLNPVFIYNHRHHIGVRLLSRLTTTLKQWEQRKEKQYFQNLRHKYAGRRGFVIGNGPSLNIADLDRLTDEITIASNKIYLAFEKTVWRPSFLTIADDLVWDKVENDLPKYFRVVHTPNYLNPLISSCQVHQWNHLGLAKRANSKANFSDNISIGAYGGYTVTFENLQFAVHLGLNPIYIIGCDHNYAGETNVSPSQKVATAVVSNHFLPNYRSPGEIVYAAPLDVMNEAYQCACDFGERNGIKIVNATRGGKLEIFERCDLDTLLAKP